MKTCFECDAPAQHEHHVIPKSRGGTRTIPLCVRCHGIVHDIAFTNHSTLVQDAIERRRKAGEIIGTVPFGWRTGSDGKTLVEDERESAVASLVRDMYASGSTCPEIVNVLCERGYKSRRGTFYSLPMVVKLSGRAKDAPVKHYKTKRRMSAESDTASAVVNVADYLATKGLHKAKWPKRKGWKA